MHGRRKNGAVRSGLSYRVSGAGIEHLTSRPVAPIGVDCASRSPPPAAAAGGCPHRARSWGRRRACDTTTPARLGACSRDTGATPVRLVCHTPRSGMRPAFPAAQARRLESVGHCAGACTGDACDCDIARASAGPGLSVAAGAPKPRYSPPALPCCAAADGPPAPITATSITTSAATVLHLVAHARSHHPPRAFCLHPRAAISPGSTLHAPSMHAASFPSTAVATVIALCLLFSATVSASAIPAEQTVHAHEKRHIPPAGIATLSVGLPISVIPVGGAIIVIAYQHMKKKARGQTSTEPQFKNEEAAEAEAEAEEP